MIGALLVVLATFLYLLEDNFFGSFFNLIQSVPETQMPIVLHYSYTLLLQYLTSMPTGFNTRGSIDGAMAKAIASDTRSNR